jgi:hypothetical protein
MSPRARRYVREDLLNWIALLMLVALGIVT